MRIRIASNLLREGKNVLNGIRNDVVDWDGDYTGRKRNGEGCRLR